MLQHTAHRADASAPDERAATAGGPAVSGVLPELGVFTFVLRILQAKARGVPPLLELGLPHPAMRRWGCAQDGRALMVISVLTTLAIFRGQPRRDGRACTRSTTASLLRCAPLQRGSRAVRFAPKNNRCFCSALHLPPSDCSRLHFRLDDLLPRY